MRPGGMGLTRRRHTVTLGPMTIVHACCVIIGEAGILIRGPSGSGKSDLTLRLIDEGAQLVADDYCEIKARKGVLRAQAPAPIAGNLEVRGYGILTLPFVTSASVGLVVNLADEQDIERLPEESTCQIDGIPIPQAWIDPKSPSASARVRLITSSLSHSLNSISQRA